MAQPVGLVVEPVVLNRLGIFPESATTVLADWQHGVALRLVVAPRGESSGHLTFPLEPMTTVDGRPMLAALQMLLGPDRLFEGGSSATRLKPLLAASRREQNEVSTRLAEQVLEALWILVKDFDAAGAPPAEPQHIYGGLITVLLRLVFLLYAKDEELMPTDTRYDQHYSVGGLAQCLRQDRADHQNAMEGPGCLGHTDEPVPPRLRRRRLQRGLSPGSAGDLFDPETYPFLEGRTADTAYTDGPLVPSVGRALEIGGIQHGHRPVAGPAAQGDHSNQEH